MHPCRSAQARELEAVRARALPDVEQMQQSSEVLKAEQKWEELGRIVKSRREFLSEKEKDELKERSLCKVCYEEEACMLLVPCDHICVCEICALRLEMCPICKVPIDIRKKVYHA